MTVHRAGVLVSALNFAFSFPCLQSFNSLDKLS